MLKISLGNLQFHIDKLPKLEYNDGVRKVKPVQGGIPMKSVYSENYYRENMDRFLKQYAKNADLEHDLDLKMTGFDMLPEEALAVVRKMQAKKVYVAHKEWCMKRMQMIQRIESGKSSLGFTSRTQEIHELHNIRQEFEFTCLMVADFRKKYGIE